MLYFSERFNSALIINNMTRKTACLVLLSPLLIGLHLCADTIYTNLGPADSWNGFAAYNGGSYFGTTFTATTSGILTSVLIPVQTNTGSAQADTVGLYEDVSEQPGALLESWTALLPPGGNIPPLTDLTSLNHPVLVAGAQYWLVIEGSTAGVIWDFNNQSVQGGIWTGLSLNQMTQDFPFDAEAAIQVNGTTVPERRSAVLCGLIFVFLRIRRRPARAV